MPAPRKPVTVAIEDTFNFWRQETNATVALWNYFLNESGYFVADEAVLTNVNIDGGTVQNVTILNSTLEPTASGAMVLNNVDINDSRFTTGTVSNSVLENSDVTNITGSGYWNVGNATLNIATGTESDANDKGVGGTSELFWDRTRQQLRIYDGASPGGKVAAIDGISPEDALALIIALG